MRTYLFILAIILLVCSISSGVDFSTLQYPTYYPLTNYWFNNAHLTMLFTQVQMRCYATAYGIEGTTGPRVITNILYRVEPMSIEEALIIDYGTNGVVTNIFTNVTSSIVTTNFGMTVTSRPAISEVFLEAIDEAISNLAPYYVNFNIVETDLDWTDQLNTNSANILWTYETLRAYVGKTNNAWTNTWDLGDITVEALNERADMLVPLIATIVTNQANIFYDQKKFRQSLLAETNYWTWICEISGDSLLRANWKYCAELVTNTFVNNDGPRNDAKQALADAFAQFTPGLSTTSSTEFGCSSDFGDSVVYGGYFMMMQDIDDYDIFGGYMSADYYLDKYESKIATPVYWEGTAGVTGAQFYGYAHGDDVNHTVYSNSASTNVSMVPASVWPINSWLQIVNTAYATGTNPCGLEGSGDIPSVFHVESVVRWSPDGLFGSGSNKWFILKDPLDDWTGGDDPQWSLGDPDIPDWAHSAFTNQAAIEGNTDTEDKSDNVTATSGDKDAIVILFWDWNY